MPPDLPLPTPSPPTSVPMPPASVTVNVPPQIIEIAQKSAPVWPTWVSFSASVLLFAGAMITLFVTNRTNRTAITAADNREREKWRQDAVLKAVTAQLEISNDALRTLKKFLGWSEEHATALHSGLVHRIDDLLPHVNILQCVTDIETFTASDALWHELRRAAESAVSFAEDRHSLSGDELQQARDRALLGISNVNEAQTRLVNAVRIACGLSATPLIDDETEPHSAGDPVPPANPESPAPEE